MPTEPGDEQMLTERIVDLARQYGRYGYRRVTALLRMEGWWVNHKRVQRIWRREGLKVPTKQPNEPGCGSAMARASGCDHSAKITSGRMTSSITGRTRVGL